MAESSNRIGAFWVNKPQNERGPVLTSEVNGQRVSVFKNKRWSEADEKKQPLYHVLVSTAKKKS